MIRRYEAEDLEELLDVWYDASQIAHSFLTPEFFARERQSIIHTYLPLAETWVFEDDGRVVGFISLIGDEVGAIFVDPRQQRKGIGEALMNHARALRKRLTVEVFEANEIGRAFYDSRGFEVIGGRIHEDTEQPLLRLQLDR